jgi:hypothetical protein
MSNKPVATNRLLDIGREIAARVERLDKIGVKAVDHVDSINHLLAQAEKLCGGPEDFATFKQTYCPKLGQSRTYELLAIKEGRKTLEEIREAGRLRIAKRRATKRDVTENNSVTKRPTPEQVHERAKRQAEKKRAAIVTTLAGQSIDPSTLGATAQSQITAEASAEARKAKYADNTQSDDWQRSLANLAGDAIAMPAYWTREFGDWKKFKAPSDLVTLAIQAAKAWTELARQLATAPKERAA